MKTSRSNQARFQGLQTVLSYQLSSIVLSGIILLFISSLFIDPLFFIILIILLTTTAILLTPYMLFVLFSGKKYGWLLFFCLLVLIPLLSTLIFLSDPYLHTVVLYILLSFFYFYCYLLRHVVNDWVRETNWRTQKMQDRLEDELNRDVF